MSTPGNALTALLHIPGIDEWRSFKTTLQYAISAQLPTNLKPYNTVSVLLVVWEDKEKAFLHEATRLQKFLEEDFQFRCEIFELPCKAKCDLMLYAKIANWGLESANPGNLSILFYTGHSRRSPEEKSIWVPHSNKHFAICWSDMQTCLHGFGGDVLCILDTCYASTAGLGERIELLAATGIETQAQGPGHRLFTDTMIRAMRDYGDQPFNVAMLHSKLCSAQFRIKGGWTPLHIARVDKVQPSVFLQRLPNPTILSTPPIAATLLKVREPRVLVRFTLNTDAGLPDVTEWMTFLTTNMPSHVQKGEVSLEAVYHSGSTVMLVALPIAIWNCFEAQPGMQFIAFIDGDNLVREVVNSRRGAQRSDETDPSSVESPTSPK